MNTKTLAGAIIVVVGVILVLTILRPLIWAAKVILILIGLITITKWVLEAFAGD